MFPYSTYTENYKSIFGRKIPVGFIYTMNVTKKQMDDLGYMQGLKFSEMLLERIFGYCESLVVNDTYQFDDYSKYVVTVFDEAKKAKVREKEFPVDCQKAYDLGAKFTKIDL